MKKFFTQILLASFSFITRKNVAWRRKLSNLPIMHQFWDTFRGHFVIGIGRINCKTIHICVNMRIPIKVITCTSHCFVLVQHVGPFWEWGRLGLGPFWSGAVQVCGRSGFLTFHVGPFWLGPFRFAAILTRYHTFECLPNFEKEVIFRKYWL